MFDGQRTEQRELRCFEDLADHFLVTKRLAVSIEHLARIGGSSLTDCKIPVTPPKPDSTGIPSSYVPFRNSHLLSIATSWAEVIKARYIYIGAVAAIRQVIRIADRSFMRRFSELLMSAPNLKPGLKSERRSLQ
jgi:7-cyano-7-deazaguanine synthase